MTNRNEAVSKLANNLCPHLFSIEMIICALTLTSLYLRSSGYAFSSLLLTILLTALAITYYISAFASPEPEIGALENFTNKISFLSSSVGVMGILFLTQNWPGYDAMLKTSCIVISIAIVVNLFKFQNSKMLIRSIVILIISAGLFLTPKSQLEDSKIIKSIERDK